MFATRLNQLTARLRITPASPLLVKEGRHLSDPNRGRDGAEELTSEQLRKTRRSFHRELRRQPGQGKRRDGEGTGPYDSAEACFDMAFVWSQTSAGPRLYLPGSSLRGVLRSAAERAVGRRRPDWALAGDPFVAASAEWVKAERQKERPPSGARIYQMAGPIERLFGHTALRGRCVVADAWMEDEGQARVVVRDGVGISRDTGAAADAVKFNFEAVTGGAFTTTLRLVNYELWQLGLLAHALAALDGGEVRLGYGTRRGLGRVRVAVTGLELRWYGAQPEAVDEGYRVPALAALAARVGLTDYYGWRDAGLDLTLQLAQGEDDGLGRRWQVAGGGGPGTDWLSAPWPAMARLLPLALDDWELPAELAEFLPNALEIP